MGVDQAPSTPRLLVWWYRGDLILRVRISEEDSLGLDREKH